jgi:hypothetical protein
LANTAASRREQLGENRLALLEKLEDVGDGPVVPAKLKQRIAEVDISRVKQHQFDTSDKRPIDELLWELQTSLRGIHIVFVNITNGRRSIICML